jgi:hypothetical protein
VKVALETEYRSYGCCIMSGLRGDISTHPGRRGCLRAHRRALALPASPRSEAAQPQAIVDFCMYDAADLLYCGLVLYRLSWQSCAVAE